MMRRIPKRWQRRLLRTILSSLTVIIILLFSILGKVDYTHYKQASYYKNTLPSFDSLSFDRPLVGDTIKVGWAQQNITPSKPCNLAGFGNRGDYESILDSINTRTILLDNANTRIAMVTLDLIMIHPELERQLDSAILGSNLNIDGVYYSATHTHSSIGHWGKKFGFSYVMGDYRQDICDMLVSKTLKSLKEANQNLEDCQVAYKSVNLSDYVHNRIVFESDTDDYLRMLIFKKNTGEKAVYCTFSAHPTILSETNKALSNDYVGYFLNGLKNKFEFDFAMFSAGAVGSHAPSTWMDGAETVQGYANELLQKVKIDSLSFQSKVRLGYSKINFQLGEPQLRSRYLFGFRLKTWVFNWLLGNLNPNLKFAQIGEYFFVGTPCDFSGEYLKKLENIALKKSKQLMVTSFNGGYLGYAVPSEYYELIHSETHEMNWFGPFLGDYINELIATSITKIN